MKCAVVHCTMMPLLKFQIIRVLSFQELFSKAYENVGVLFASIPNFTQFYSEDVNRGMECIRLLNEIIGNMPFYVYRVFQEVKG